MILSGVKIEKEIKNKNISISPFQKALLGPNSYNYHLDKVLYEITDKIIDPLVETNYKKIIIPKSGYILKPNKLYLASTKEKIGSKKYITFLSGRSSMGRLGLFLHITAPFGHAGCYHNWTLELKVVEPLKIYPNMNIGQVYFLKRSGAIYKTKEIAKYNKHQKPNVSLFYKEHCK